MSQVTVKQLASTVGVPVERLLAQLNEAGITADGAESTLTEQEKIQLLGYLRRSHGKVEAEGDDASSPNRVTLKRKSVTELRQPVVVPRSPLGTSRPVPASRAKTVSVEVRRKRTYVKRDQEPTPEAKQTAPVQPQAAAEKPQTPPVPPKAAPEATQAAQVPPKAAAEATQAAQVPPKAAPEATQAAQVPPKAAPEATQAAQVPPQVAPEAPQAEPAPLQTAPVAETAVPATPKQPSTPEPVASKPAAPKPPASKPAPSRAVAPKPGARSSSTRSTSARRPDQRRKAPSVVVVDEARRRGALEALRAEQEARRLADAEEQERQRREEDERRRKEDEARKRAAAEEAARLAAEEAARLVAEEAERLAAESADTSRPVDVDDSEEPVRRRPESPRKPAAATGKRSVAVGGKKTVDLSEKERSIKKSARKDSLRARELEAPRSADYQEKDIVLGAGASRRKKKGAKPQLKDKHLFQRPTAPVVREVEVPDTISVGELAGRMSVKAGDLIKELFKQGMMVTINQSLDRDTAVLLVEEMGHKAVLADERTAEDTLIAESDAQLNQAELKSRPPVVTIMGHVDHGKTSLLDFIRRTRVASGEAGGITQHIGAYHVETSRGVISFLDTPGHAAFSAMRARGAKVTDIVVLVVAADDGVMPQTIEAIQHAKASEVPIVVAVNKMDKPDANPDRVMQELSQHGVQTEAWGGDTQLVKVSAKTGDGIDDLLDAILLQAELLELQAPEDGPAQGAIVESSLDKGRGPVATVLVQSGTLHRGDMIVSGSEYGRVRAMFDESGKAVQSAGPSIPVQVLGLSATPNAGDDVLVVTDERRAREVAELRTARTRRSKLEEQRGVSLDQLFSQIKEGEQKSLNIVIKADVQGSMEALRDSLLKLSGDEVKLSLVATGVGGITESDANLALTSNAILLGFNVRADAAARRVVDEKSLDLRYYSVIYELIDDVKKAISGMLSPVVTEEIVGLAQVRDVFRSSKFGAVAGSMVLEGHIKRNLPIRVLRDNVVIYEGALESLRRFKDDVQEVKAGTECGIGVKNYNDVQVGDQIEVFERTERARVL